MNAAITRESLIAEIESRSGARRKRPDLSGQDLSAWILPDSTCRCQPRRSILRRQTLTKANLDGCHLRHADL